MPREKNIDVVLDPPNIVDVAGNPMTDSVLSFSFRIAPADTVGNVIITTGSSGNLFGELIARESSSLSYRGYADQSGSFKFDTVMPGVYNFHYFDDADSNGIWSQGDIVPFKPAERFYFYADSIDVRSRWTTDVGKID